MNQHLKVATRLANLLDNRFQIGPYRFGISGLINIIPGVGDVIDVVLSLYLVWIAFQMEVPGRVMAQMVGNIAVNFVVGAVPFLGDLVYIFRRVNLKNLQLLQRYAASTAEAHHVVG